MAGHRLHELAPADSFLEWAFLRWVLGPATRPGMVERLRPQQPAGVVDRQYRIDYVLAGAQLQIAVELDGYAFHSSRDAFTYDRLRQNDLTSLGYHIVRFSYDAIRTETGRCISQLQAALLRDPLLAALVEPHPMVETPDMPTDPLRSLDPAPAARPFGSPPPVATYFDRVRDRLQLQTLRLCQREALTALTNYYVQGRHAACVMSVGAGKTALGAATALAFARRRALIVTPGTVIRGTFDRALNYQHPKNVLYTLPGGPLIPGMPPPTVLTLDRDNGAIARITREQLLAADIIITNFHSLGTGADPDDLLAKLGPNDVDLVVVDEAHIAASESYQRLFAHFSVARTLLMSACFQRLDGKPIDADVVYRYRLIDSIADGHAKNLRMHRFASEAEATTYEMVWPSGATEEIVGRDALLAIIGDERKLAHITAKSHEPIRHLMRLTRAVLDAQTTLLNPVKPRVLFSALGHRHAEQIARIATEQGIPSAALHHSQTETQIKSTLQRFESDAGDLQGVVHLKMLGQGYDFPPICVVAPMRPYGSFSEFYQFVGRGIRVIHHPALTGRVGPEQQFLDVIYHSELGLDDHIDQIYAENDMDPATVDHTEPYDSGDEDRGDDGDRFGTRGHDTAERPDTFVLFERGATEETILHDENRIETAKNERELAAFAQRYADYARGNPSPVSFEQFTEVIRGLRD